MIQSTGYEHLTQNAGGAQSLAPNSAMEISPSSSSGAGPSTLVQQQPAGTQSILALELNASTAIPIPDEVAKSPYKTSS